MTRTAKCRVCGHAIRWVARRYCWVHVSPPRIDHAPFPGDGIPGDTAQDIDRLATAGPDVKGNTPRDHRVTREGNTGGMTPGGAAVRQHDGTARSVSAAPTTMEAMLSPDSTPARRNDQ